MAVSQLNSLRTLLVTLEAVLREVLAVNDPAQMLPWGLQGEIVRGFARRVLHLTQEMEKMRPAPPSTVAEGRMEMRHLAR